MEETEIPERTQELAEAGSANRLNKIVAATVAIIAIFMMMCNVKDGNIVQAMMQAQAKELDQWNYYQAKSLKQHTYQVQVEQWSLQEAIATPPLSADARGKVEAQIADWKQAVAKYDKDQADIKAAAEGAHKEYYDLNFRDDQFDFSEALLGLAITLMAVCSLTRSRVLYGLGALVAVGGIIMGLAAFCQWQIHPGIISLLT